ncbi:type II toxin-antitoxin system RelE/ParE family toxin [Silvibacterium sp.]|uniref:type II toxin-antitoxin system RelE/ParE family toxin n=1 Tax=Silvibacterium sp. TaxID=1964179 RepID=UPI0039E4D48B
MIRYKLSARAKREVFDIWLYIARENIEAADRVEAAIYDACEFVAANPMAGGVRTELTGLPLRFWGIPGFPSYLLVYSPHRKPLLILRVLHGARDLRREVKRR